MSSAQLPARPNLEHLKHQARSLLRNAQAGDAQAGSRFAAHGIDPAQAKLADALHATAREYGFDTWPALKLHVTLASAEPVQALIAAIKANDAEAVRNVMAQHASLRAAIDEPLPGYGFDEPALLSAVHKQNADMVDAILDAGADINARSRWWAGGFGVLDFAAPALAAHLIARGATLDIHSAARLGMLDRVHDFLADDASLVHARGGDGQLPLHFAASVEIAAALLDAGANLDARDIDHESTAVQYMVSAQPVRHEVAAYLVERGARADLFVACALGDLALAERLLNEDPEIVRDTVSDRSFPKADPRAGGTIYLYGFGVSTTPHMVAHRFGHSAVFDLLMQRSAPWLRLVQAAELNDKALADSIVERHPDLLRKLNVFAARRLVGVAVRNNAGAVGLLLGYGWPVDAMLENRQTALHHAAYHGNLAMVQVLLAHKAPVDVREQQYGGSPLDWALHGSLHGWHRATGDYPGVVRALLDAGAELGDTGTPRDVPDEVLEVLEPRAG